MSLTSQSMFDKTLFSDIFSCRLRFEEERELQVSYFEAGSVRGTVQQRLCLF